MVKISVVIPVYNSEAYIDSCLDSLLSQDFKDLEIICINDGSTDNSLSKLKKYTSIKLIDKLNTGAGDSRNIGLKNAIGEYVLFLDSDDFLEPQALSKIYNKISSDQSDILFFNVNKYFEQSGIKNFYNFVQPYFERFGESVFSPTEASGIIFQTTAHPFKIYNREALMRIGAKYSHLVFVEDQLLFFKLLFNVDKISVLNDVVYNYRIHDNSETSKGKKHFEKNVKSFYVCEDGIKGSKHYDILINEFINNRIDSLFYWFGQESSNRLNYQMLKNVLKHIYDNYGKDIYQNNFHKKQIDRILKYPFIVYDIVEKCETSIMTISSHLN